MFLKMQKRKLHNAPIKPDSRILDLCTGSGIWCVDIGDLYPCAHVIGVDICPFVPDMVPPNVQFRQDDVEHEADWNWSHQFDYIHSRNNTGVFKDPQKLILRSFHSLENLGWLELADFDMYAYSLDNSLTRSHAISHWCAKMCEASEKEGKSLRFGRELESLVREAGFENIQSRKMLVPLGSWAEGEWNREIGKYNWAWFWEGLEGFSWRPFVKVLGWSWDSLQVLLAQVRNEMKDPAIRVIFDL